MLRGYARSHYAALCFVNCVIEDVGGLLSELPDVDAARLNTIQTRCELYQPAIVQYIKMSIVLQFVLMAMSMRLSLDMLFNIHCDHILQNML